MTRTHTAARTHTVAFIPGDGIGIEVSAATRKVLAALEAKCGDFHLAIAEKDYGSLRYLRTGAYAPKGWLEDLQQYEAIFFGAVGHPDIEDHISLWQLILPIRQAFQQYVNVRPCRPIEGVPSLVAAGSNVVDWVILRENTEGEYAGQGGRTHVGTPHEVATEVAVFTRVGVERFLRYAFSVAAQRPRKRLTLVTKSNAQRFGLVLWDEVAAAVAKDFPAVHWDKMLVDAMTVRMACKPHTLDTIVATNLHGDILSDLAAGLCGSIGLAPSSSLNPSRERPSLFEPVHGAAFDIMGQDVANPVAALWSACEMLKWLGEDDAAARLDAAIHESIRRGITTADLGGTCKTSEVTEGICSLLSDA